MRIPVNLAGQPFRHNRAMLVGSAAAALAMLMTLGLLISQAVTSRRQAAQTQALLDRVDRQLANTRREQTRLDSQMHQPINEVALDRIVFLNDLIKLKATSWTRIFADLEKVLPPNVRIVSIRPAINSRDEVFLDMQVAADAPEQIIAFILKLESSDIFGATAVSVITPPSQTENSYRYRLSVNYAQKL